METTPLQVRLHAPVVCRCAGLPFNRLDGFRRDPSRTALWALLDDADFLDCLVTMNPDSVAKPAQSAPKRSSRTRHVRCRRAELTLYRYLTRFAAATIPAGMAGWTFWGRDGRVDRSRAGRGRKKRHVYPRAHAMSNASDRLAHGALRSKAVSQIRPWYVKTDTGTLDAHSGCFTDEETTVMYLRPELRACAMASRRDEVAAALDRLVSCRRNFASLRARTSPC